MKQLKSTFLLTVLMSMVSICVSASVEVDGIYYNLSSYEKTAEVTYYLAEGVRNTASSSFVGIYSGNVTIPSSITYQGETYTVTKIGRQAFYKSNELASVVIPSSVTFIDEGAFEICPNLTSVNIPNDITTISSSTFSGCSSLSSITIPNSVTTIGNYAFSGCSTLTSIEIPNSVTTIGSSAFRGCSSLTSISIPNGVTTIWGHAFRDCSSLTSIIIPNSLTTISNYTFLNCDGLTSISIPNSVTTIEDGAFMDCSNLSSITIPNSVTSIGNDVFNDCGALSSISVDNDNLKYDSRNNCNALIETETNTLLRGCKNTSIPTSVTTIGNHAFRGCSSLTSISIPNGVTTIGDGAFRGCSSLTSISIPNSVTTIGDGAFLNCDNLSSITIPNSVTSIGSSAFSGCKGLTSVTIPNSVTSIGSGAFWNCSNLASATLSNNITSIDSYTFCNCISLASITIPKSVTSIGNWAFDGCQQLTSMTIYHETPPQIGNYIFSKRTYATLYVPAGCKAAYEAADYWKDFKEIIEMAAPSPTIAFADTNVKALCVANWDTNGDGELSEAEAAAVTNLGEVFKYQKTITSFDELQYFTGLTSIGYEAFVKCSSLTFVTIPYSVTCIDGDAFRGCSALTSITIPNNVTSIGKSVFEDCYGLTSVTIPNSVISIGKCAFLFCSGLTSITIPSSVTSIEDGVFDGCNSLTSITVESGNTKYDSRNNCNAIIETANNMLIAGCKNTIIPNSVTSIGEYAFYNCNGLTSFTITNSVTSIGDYAFGKCKNLTSITIPNSVTSIGEYAFYNCSALTSVTIESETPVTITSTVFPNRANTTLYVPYGCKAAYEAADYWKEFKEIVEMADLTPTIVFADANVKALCLANWDYNGDGKLTEAEAALVTDLGNVFKYKDVITSFEELQYFTGLTSIGEGAFNGCSGLTSVTIPNSVTSIGNFAFWNCSSLTSIIIPNSVTSIGEGAFCHCSGLTSITVESGNTNYDSRDNSNAIIETASNTLLYGCINSIIPNSVTSIGSYAFWGCSSLTSINIPNSVTTIGDAAFQDCISLTTINVESGNTKYDSRNDCNAIIETANNKLIAGCKNTVIPNSVTSIGNYAFAGCAGLTSITIPNSVTSIGTVAFYGCTSLTSVTIPNSVTSIGNSAFAYCTGLTSITIPNSVTSIGEAAFIYCEGLTSITIPNSVTSISSYAFSYCSGLTSITIPNSVTSVGAGAFDGCTSLTSITIPNSVTSIGTGAFDGCTSLTSITIPNSVTSIGYEAFNDCSNMTTVNVYWEVPIMSFYAFSHRKNATLYVPYGCKAAYEAAYYWKEFKEIVEMAPSPTIAFANANVKALCLANWDYNGDGKLTEAEAALVTDLGEVFKNNKNITSFNELQYFTGLTSIGEGAFDGCTGLTSITIPNSVTSIGESAFTGCTALTSVTIPNSVTRIGSGAFSGCSDLTFITVESGNTNYDSRDNCNAIIETSSNTLIAGCKNTTIPNSVTSIGEIAFANHYGLTSITIPNSVTSIGDCAFAYCPGLTSISIPNSVTSISYDAFISCSGLTSITVESGNTKYDSRDNCNAIIETASNTLIAGCKNTIIPNSVTSIGSNAFEDCSALTSIIIPNSVTSIGRHSFRGCRFTSVTIPNSVTSIGEYAFYNCSALTSVTIESETPVTITSTVFSNRANATLYVPAGSKAAYEAADYWKEFKEIIEFEVPVEDTDIALLDNTVYVNQTEVFTGNEATLSIRMKNTAAIRGFQFDMYLPEGITPMKNSKGRILATLTNDRLEEDDEHTLTSSEQPDGAIRFLCGSQYEETFTGNDGEVFTLKVSVAEDMEDGDYPLLMKNIKLSENNISNYYEVELVKTTLSVSSYILGDINTDGKVDVSDYIGVANYILGHTPEGFVMQAGDVDDSEAIDVSDYLGIGNIIHTGSVYGSNRAMGARASVEPSDLTTMDNVVYVLPETAEPGEDMTLSLCMKNTAAIRGFQFDLYLPEGVTVKKNSKGRILAALNKARLEEDDEHTLTTSEQPDGAIRFLCGSQYEETFTGTDGEVATLQVTVSSDMVAGDYPVILKDMKLSENDIRNFYETEQVVTMLTIPNTIEFRVLLDESSTTEPEVAAGVDVRVVKTLSADEWTSICLPFAMTAEQITAAFGSNVLIGDFNDYELADDENSITVKFNLVTAIAANHPYIIKVSETIEGFTADGVDIDPQEAEINKGTKRRPHSFVGTYEAGTKVEEECLYMSEGSLLYSDGTKSVNAFSGYFDFIDVLESSDPSAELRTVIDESISGLVKIQISYDTGTMVSQNRQHGIEDTRTYNLQGQRIEHPKKGLYIKDNRKVIIK